MADASTERWIRAGITDGRFRLVYQPIRSFADRRVIAVEALLRLTPEDITDEVAPSVFIDLAERLSLMASLGAVSIARCMRDLTDAAPDPDPLRIAVNLTASQVHDPDTVAQLSNAMTSAGVAPGRVIVELSERTIFGQPVGSAAFIRAAHERGIAISVNDYGSDETNLFRVTELPISYIKIDRALVTRLPGSAAAQRRIATLTNLAPHLGVQTIAVGVESAEQHALMASLGVDHGQGFWISPPQASIAAALAEAQ